MTTQLHEAQAAAEASTGELLAELVAESRALASKELELAKTELLEDVRREIIAATGIGIGAVCGLITAILLLVAVALSITAFPPWESTLIVAAVVTVFGAGAAALGWSVRVRRPLERTQKTLRDDLRLAKDRLS